jgi:hypothetical protein
MKKTLNTVLIALSIAISISCGTNKSTSDVVKMSSSDPFKNTISETQFFEIDTKADNVVEGDRGVIIICPKGSFVDGAGNIVEGNVKLELAEGVGIEDMILSNLTTTSNGKLLETGGMIYFNATHDGEQLYVNKAIPVHFEIPTPERKPGMMAYKGIRDENGNMNWVDPKPLDNYLKTVDMTSLDFLPAGFEQAVQKGLPFRKHKTLSQSLVDSLYYSLSVSNGEDLTRGLVDTNVNEPYYNKDSKEVGKRYTKESYQTNGDSTKGEVSEVYKLCGVMPSAIKIIRSREYQNTFIATKEFESRMQAIFSSCEISILELYVTNLDKNLFELDSLAAIECDKKKHPMAQHAFTTFFEQHLTNVRQADKIALLLKGYYETQIKKVTAELEKNKELVLKELEKRNAAAQKLIDKYRKLLWKREQYRMETYGFDWTETGWINVDNGTLPKWWASHEFEVKVTNGKEFDRVYTYVIYSAIKSLYRLNSTDSVDFYVGNTDEKQMLMPNEGAAVVISIGYKNDQPSIAVSNFELGSTSQVSHSLATSSLQAMKELLSKYERYSEKNRISTDLEYMAKIYKEQQRQKTLRNEADFIYKLFPVAFPCCLSPRDSVYERMESM